jgi:hypothetical protein
MKSFALLLAMSSLLIYSCRDDIKEKAEPVSVPEEPKNFFPVLDFIKGEIAYVDSFPLKMTRYSIQNGHTDSSFIQSKEFDQLSREFLDSSLDKASLEREFSENSFLDQTSQSLTFTYTRKNGQDGIYRIDVLASQDPAHDKVKSVYIEKKIRSSDSTIIKKMFWKSKRNFQVISIARAAKGTDLTSQLKVVWDERP